MPLFASDDFRIDVGRNDNDETDRFPQPCSATAFRRQYLFIVPESSDFVQKASESIATSSGISGLCRLPASMEGSPQITQMSADRLIYENGRFCSIHLTPGSLSAKICIICGLRSSEIR
jgi:hypothetical protein